MDKPIDLQKLALELKSLNDCTELRDKFAMAALTGMLAGRNPNCGGVFITGKNSVDAQYIWQIADAMLEARKQGINNGN